MILNPEDQSIYDTLPQNVRCEYIWRHRSHFKKDFTIYVTKQ